ncbi:hypothetical protein MKW98_017168 [Papaver atlanticum]|uniref:Succinate dehydrogenase assembly factor 4, mitochondrial n=1 Tax=Papaver atlanticum TaxID=357466 RepID=A0AAD4SBY5_9MAGN|nr:hypothetical protein MKW98_017168 [Papaver atlanticum]
MAKRNLSRLFSSLIGSSNKPSLGFQSESIINSISPLQRGISTTTITRHDNDDEKKKTPKISVEEEEKGSSSSDEEEEEDDGVNKLTGEIGGPRGPEPTRYGDWEKGGRCSDF